MRFLGSELEKLPPEACYYHVIPVPMEDTVSYGSGTSMGPRAIIQASNQLEVWTGRADPSRHGIHTWPLVECAGPPQSVLAAVRQAVHRAFAARARQPVMPVVLGGEHSITQGTVAALLQYHERIGVIQIDAHADLRPEYQGTPYSHACVMRRILDLGCPLAQFGVRSLSPAERCFREEQGIFHLDARPFYENHGLDGLSEPLLPADFPKTVFLTFDVDGLDPSVIPATGTPEPGGLLWYDALGLAERALRGRTLVGFDVVELAPILHQHWPDFAAARLTYELMALAMPD